MKTGHPSSNFASEKDVPFYLLPKTVETDKNLKIGSCVKETVCYRRLLEWF